MVWVGSRDAAKARSLAQELRGMGDGRGLQVEGGTNAEAAERADVVFWCIQVMGGEGGGVECKRGVGKGDGRVQGRLHVTGTNSSGVKPGNRHAAGACPGLPTAGSAYLPACNASMSTAQPVAMGSGMLCCGGRLGATA